MTPDKITPLKIVAIETDSGRFFISEEEYRSYNDSLPRLLFDGKSPEKSFCEGWYIVKNKPTKITRRVRQPSVNYRYELIDKAMTTEKIPLIFKRDEVERPADHDYWKEEFSHLRSLYSLMSDSGPDKEEEVPFEFSLLMKIKDISTPTKLGYKIKVRSYDSEPLGTLTEKDIHYSLVERLIFPKVIIHERPCFLTSEQTYKIVRQHIKDHIDPVAAEITSDYDFCFTVQRRIPLSESENYTVNTNLFSGRKPKYENRCRRQRIVHCFEMTHSPYNYKGYTPIQGFEAENSSELKKKIDDYCKNLMKFINVRLADCPHCKGLGVTLPKEIK